ncbi:hypothetical protein CDEST_15043 [Colletotrichum destructivum]|uniref:Uncharacterized protein n=1 Tax=Colletotrichum destructivum TaxID=34406 RepID=A0AAX4J372_9PEZI|nr:hypothetical protein CDEST_15043 [Colletotrichum destructivum]
MPTWPFNYYYTDTLQASVPRQPNILSKLEKSPINDILHQAGTMPINQEPQVSDQEKEVLEQPWKQFVTEASQDDPQELVKSQAVFFEATNPSLAG